MQPSLSSGIVEEHVAESGDHVLQECMLVQLRTQVPLVTSQLTITARCVCLCFWGVLFRNKA